MKTITNEFYLTGEAKFVPYYAEKTMITLVYHLLVDVFSLVK